MQRPTRHKLPYSPLRAILLRIEVEVRWADNNPSTSGQSRSGRFISLDARRRLTECTERRAISLSAKSKRRPDIPMVKPACINGHLNEPVERFTHPVRLRAFGNSLVKLEKLSLCLFCPPSRAMVTRCGHSLRPRGCSFKSFCSKEIAVFWSGPCAPSDLCADSFQL